MLLKKGQIISLWAYPAQFECSATGAYGIVDTMTLSNVIRLLISVARATIAQEQLNSSLKKERLAVVCSQTNSLYSHYKHVLFNGMWSVFFSFAFDLHLFCESQLIILTYSFSHLKLLNHGFTLFILNTGNSGFKISYCLPLNPGLTFLFAFMRPVYNVQSMLLIS